MLDSIIVGCVSNFTFFVICLIPIIFFLGIIAGAVITISLNRKWAKEDGLVRCGRCHILYYKANKCPKCNEPR